MKKAILSILLLTIFLPTSYSWGPTGHRVVGLIAEQHLSKKALKRVQAVLGTETLAEVSTFMDFIKSDSKYRHMNPWHYCTIPDGKTYEEAGTPEEGDVIMTIERLISELKSKNFSDEDEAFALKMLVHLVGDIHQPLHVGNGEDRGGNDVKLEYFYRSSNLHRVWDSGIIDEQKFSYTEYADWINHVDATQVKSWQSATVRQWAAESVTYRGQVYDIPENKKLSWRYNFDNIETVNLRLLQAGVRLAGVLETIYGS
ncbi:MAG: S1/P1 nuclease [Cytophagales bacterium]|nr:S1/P1 nuclease [Cytophagales bacterium]